MTEIKPIYQIQQLGEWIEVDKNIFDEIYIQNKFPHRILYPAEDYEALQKELAAQAKRIEIAKEYLQRLSCLGNGGLTGNSLGNVIAIEGLNKLSASKNGDSK